MGAFDNSYDDDLVEAHEESKLAAKYSKSLSDYTTEELQAELKKRKNSAKEKLSRVEAAKKHNAPLKREISKLQNELSNVTRRLKKEE